MHGSRPLLQVITNRDEQFSFILRLRRISSYGPIFCDTRERTLCGFGKWIIFRICARKITHLIWICRMFTSRFQWQRIFYLVGFCFIRFCGFGGVIELEWASSARHSLHPGHSFWQRGVQNNELSHDYDFLLHHVLRPVLKFHNVLLLSMCKCPCSFYAKYIVYVSTKPGEVSSELPFTFKTMVNDGRSLTASMWKKCPYPFTPAQ